MSYEGLTGVVAATAAPKIKSQDTRRRLDAATKAFTTVGLDSISIAALELKTGIQRRLLACHFGSKVELWRTVVGRLFAKPGGGRMDYLIETHLSHHVATVGKTPAPFLMPRRIRHSGYW